METADQKDNFKHFITEYPMYLGNLSLECPLATNTSYKVN